jgi:probable rRNA maturation factor
MRPVKLKLELSKESSRDFPLDIESLSDEIGKTLAQVLEGMEATVALTCLPDDEIKRLNGRYRNLDEATDVLSFPLWEEDGRFAPPDSWGSIPLGDVVVSPDFVRRNAERENIGYNSEMARIVAHGVLHLVGYDHDTEENRRKMWALQERIVENFIKSSDAWED